MPSHVSSETLSGLSGHGAAIIGAAIIGINSLETWSVPLSWHEISRTTGCLMTVIVVTIFSYDVLMFLACGPKTVPVKRTFLNIAIVGWSGVG